MAPSRHLFSVFVAAALISTFASTAAAQCGNGTVDPGEHGDAGKSKILLKGKGVNLAYLSSITLNAPLHIRLVRTDSPLCWEAVYSSTIQNDDKGLKATSD